MVTPFNSAMEVDFEELERLLEFQIHGGIDALVVCGTTGESATLSDSEREDIVAAACERVAGRVPVIAGVCGSSTEHAVKIAKAAVERGADALLVTTPYYNRPPQQGLVRHFVCIADAVNVPIILYDVPSRTGVRIDSETYLKLSRISNICAVKDASGDMAALARTGAQCGDRLDYYSGSDELILPVLSLGGRGVISVLSNLLPAEVSGLTKNWLSGAQNIALNEMRRLLPLISALFAESNPIPIKYAMRHVGFNVGKCRLPLVELSYDRRFLTEILVTKMLKDSISYK